VSSAFVAAVFLPSYWRFEPRDFAEGFDLTLTALALAGALLFVMAAVRAAVAWSRVARRTRVWLSAAEPLSLPGIDIPAFRVDAAQPTMALVGVVRPKLLITRGLIEALTPEELAAAIAHEVGHCSARDNLTRLAMLAAPDLLGWTAAARALERRWASAAEHRADHAASTTPEVRIALASALVKVARLTPPAPVRIVELMSTLVGGGSIAARVEELIEPADSAPPASGSRASRVAAAGAAAAFVYAYPSLLVWIHGITEFVVHLVP
jgi:Zn-dependent protease with chaperone function